MLAGHETSATTTSWALYELSKRGQLQGDLRKEIKETRARSVQRGNKGELSMADLDSMKYLLAVIKVRGDVRRRGDDALRYGHIIGNPAILSYCEPNVSRSSTR